jgi:protein involved in polysaccharide export with SLBB domain
LKRADVIRLNKDLQDRTVIPVDLEKLLAGDESQNIVLQPQDQVRVYSSFKAAEKVAVQGEVVRPGEYEINKGERLSDLLRRTGGFTTEGYAYGAVFRRKEVKSEETRYMKTLIIKTQSKILRNASEKTAAAINPEEVSSAKTEMAINQGFLDGLKAMQEQAEGRVVINITEDIGQWAGSKNDLLLQDGDSVFIPKRPQDVLVLGEVHSPGAQIYLPDMTVRDYLDRTGGLTRYADENEVFVVQADGYAFGADSPTVGDLGKVRLKAGDTIVVPEQVDRGAVLKFAKDVLDMLFKAAVIVATIHVLF